MAQLDNGVNMDTNSPASGSLLHYAKLPLVW